jgi:3-dehydroquinate synthase
MKADFSVQTPSRNYPVFVRSNLQDIPFGEILSLQSGTSVFLVMDENVEKQFGSIIQSKLEMFSGDLPVYIVPSGESSKSYDEWKSLVDFLLVSGARRNTPVLAVGGGVTGDLAGFAASSVMRGIPLIHLPTTLLAMVDSSLGGKTGINHRLGKNLIGSFYQPQAIIMNTGFLSTLPGKQWINGLSEILKYAAIRDQSIFETCETLFLNRSVSAGNSMLDELIRKCAKIKADIVADDEKESGLRMILNYGHTFAHALENRSGYNKISHGEAVFTGMIAATYLSNKLGANLELSKLERFKDLYKIDTTIGSIPVSELVDAMYHDKKRLSENLKLVLLQDWATPYVREMNDTSLISEAWNYAFNLISSK